MIMDSLFEDLQPQLQRQTQVQAQTRIQPQPLRRIRAGAQMDISEMLGCAPGFRLKKLEMYNWGTFDGSVQTFAPENGTSLLTGESGSGKSTLVDAILTLLISPRKIMYNKAADASAKERSVTSYVRGYYGQKKGAEGSGQAESLREYNHYSVILAVFNDPGLNRDVTLAKLFRFMDTSKPPQPFFVAADRELSIAAHFALGKNEDVASLKKRLKDKEAAEVFDDYKRYSEVFCRKLGIDQMQALDLFQQTVAMKKVEELTGFVRTHMLEDPGMRDDVDKMIGHFQDLNNAYEAVKRAKDQIEMLNPIREDGQKRLQRIADRETLLSARAALGPWFALRKIDLIDKELHKLESRLETAEARVRQMEDSVKSCEAEIDRKKSEIRSNGGDALENLKAEIQRSEKELERVKKNRADYSRLAENLSLRTPENSDEFIGNRRRLPELKNQEESLWADRDAKEKSAVAEQSKLEDKAQTVREEIESLRLRKSSIPREQIMIRQKLCDDLGLQAEKLPFAGELIEVNGNESRWEGAIERLLHNFGLSMLVPDTLYPGVMEWTDRTYLKSRLVYYRIFADKKLETPAPAHPDSVIGKIDIKSGSAFFDWLRREISSRFPHVCCNNPAEFRREISAVTLTGQIKTKGGRHEKDDRHGINDRSRYVLGFSNQKKIGALEKIEEELAEQIRRRQKTLAQISAEQRQSQERLNSLSQLDFFRGFEDIDQDSLRRALDDMQKKRMALERGNDVLAQLERQLEALEDQREYLKTRYEVLVKERADITAKIEQTRSAKLEAVEMAAGADPDRMKAGDAFLKENLDKALNGKSITISSAGVLETDYRQWLDDKIDGRADEIEKLSNKLVRQMADFNGKYPENTRETDANVESLPDYDRMLDELIRDDLPRFENRFKELLNENTLNQIALFQANLNQAQNTIRKRIEQINSSLYDIDYNEGRYIRLEYDESFDKDIREFRAQLRACTEGALAGSGGEPYDQYAETKFLQVKLIIERFHGRPGETERDWRWTEKVTDVRNWFLFSASERWRETGEEYEHYTDSGGKSGGQKEKLAYMILAASLVYHYGLDDHDAKKHSFRFVMIDEAFLKSSDESAKFGLELFKKLDLQVLIVTPLLKIHTIEPYISHVGFVHHDDITHKSVLRNLTIETYARERRMREQLKETSDYAAMD